MSQEPFVAHRNLLFTVAYEMLGSAADAEDVVQEAWLRWSRVDHDQVEDPRAYLVRIVIRLAIDRQRALARRREDYVGPWLPDPLLTAPDVAEDIELVENISIAMLTVLETLRPAERAVFVLREVFGFPYDDIADAVDKSPAAVRQIAHRAREHVASRRPRMQVGRAEQQQVVERFLAALSGGDVQGLMEELAPDVVLIADGGGRVTAASRPVEGAARITAFLSRLPRWAPDAQLSTFWINGSLGARVDRAGAVDTVVTFTVEDGRITRIHAIRNPDKLHWVDAPAPLTRA